MSNVHVASAANEVAQALPSTATVTVSKHGIQAIETLNLDAQSASDKSLTWSRTFSGMEILTNPVLQYSVVTTFRATRSNSSLSGAAFSIEENMNALKKHLRLRSDPIANAASSINVTINNASMAIQPARDHRIVNTTYPDEPVVANQRQHYGLNQLDRWAEPRERDFAIVTQDDVEHQFNANALRQNYPCRFYAAEAASAGADPDPGKYILIDPSKTYAVVAVVGLVATTGIYNLFSKSSDNGTSGGKIYGRIYVHTTVSDADSNDVRYYALLDQAGKPIRSVDVPDVIGISKLGNTQQQLALAQDTDTADSVTVTTAVYPRKITIQSMYVKDIDTDNSTNGLVTPYEFEFFKAIHDVSQPLAHPYFRDNVMRDNTLVNARYFDCQITLSDVGKLVEAVSPGGVWANQLNNASAFLQFPETTNYTTNLFLSSASISGEDAFQLGVNTAPSRVSTGRTPRLIFDLVTPSVPLPTISDKVVSTFHTMTSSSVGSLPVKDLKSGNIQLSQIPDKIYVFCKSSLMEVKASTLQTQPSTRLGVCTKLRIRTPQNSAFLIEMDQESLYQMSCRNGCKQSRDAFMCTLGSVVCIDPEKDLGGYTNGVLLPYTFDVQADFAQPCASGTDSILWRSDIISKTSGRQPILTSGETWTLFVVCELHGHLYLMSDGTGKQTKSNLTVTEVADAVAEGLQHPSTLGNQARSQKMDAGVLAEVARAGETRDALRG